MMKIGIYDSGCGGFSVLKEVLNKKVNCPIIYYGDSGNNPWGNKSKEKLHKILIEIAGYFEKHNVTHIITGCNTTVSIFKNNLKEIFNKPVQSLFDHTIQNYKHSEYSILSTENSSKNKLFTHFLSKNKIANIEEIACPDLANLIETNQMNLSIKQLKEKIEIAKYKNIILGCTHYPLILGNLKSDFPDKTFINPANYINLTEFDNKVITNSIPAFYTTGGLDLFNQQIKTYLNLTHYSLNNKIVTEPKVLPSSSLAL